MKVSVSVITYNHEKYIKKAIDSILMQKTDFKYEILLGEDDSIDGTRDIVKDYGIRYPDRIRVFLNSRKNVLRINGTATGRLNLINNITQARGKYVALLEGDDYWTDPHKLQKQVNLLESRPDFSMCFHWVDQFNQNSKKIKYPRYGPKSVKEFYTFDDLLRCGNFIGTCSVMFRNKLFAKFPSWFYHIPVGDFPLHLINSRFGNIGFIDECMGVYRIHEKGFFGEMCYSEKCKTMLNVYAFIGNAFNLWNNFSFQSGILNFKKMLCKAYLSEGKNLKALIAGIDTVSFKKNRRFFYSVDELLKYLSPNIYGKIFYRVFRTSKQNLLF